MRWISLVSGHNQKQAAISNPPPSPSPPPPPPPSCTRSFSQKMTVAEWCDGLSPRLNNSWIPVWENVLLELGLYQFIALYGLIVCGRGVGVGVGVREGGGNSSYGSASLHNLHWNEKKVWWTLFFPLGRPILVTFCSLSELLKIVPGAIPESKIKSPTSPRNFVAIDLNS